MNSLVIVSVVGILLSTPVMHSVVPSRYIQIPVIIERGDSPGAFVSGLTEDDFEVNLDGRPRSIERLSSGRSGAVVLLLVDLSFSATTGTPREGGPWSGSGHDFPGLLRGIQKSLLPRLRPIDVLIVGGFAGRRVWFSQALSDRANDSSVVKSVLDVKALDAVDWFGPSPIWDAVVSATRVLAGHRGLRAIILVTDGLATGNRASPLEAGAVATANGAQVHVVYDQGGFLPNTPSLRFATGDVLLRPLAERTGGLFRHDQRYTQTSWREPVPPFAEIIDAIQHSYLLTLNLAESDASGGSLSVRVKPAGLRVHAPASLAAALPSR